MTISMADLHDAPELTQVEIDSLPASATADGDSLELYVSNRLQRWAGYMTGEMSPLQARGDRVVLKACVDGEIVGFLAGHLTTRHDRDAEIQACHVRRQYQRFGIDERLLLRFIAWSQQHNAHSLCVELAQNNPYRERFARYGGEPLGTQWICWDDTELLAEHIRRALIDDVYA